MFESIKLRIIKGRQLNPFATAKVLQEHEDRLNALEGGESTATRSISVTVKDSDDNPVKDATVSIGDITGTTGSAGGCTLKNVPDGSQTIQVTKDGFNDYSNEITVSKNKTSFTINLIPSN